MKKGTTAILVLTTVLLAGPAQAEDTDTAASSSAPNPKAIHYRSGKEVNFENLLIHGDLQKPEVLIVTGNEAQSQDGILRLRESFLDRMSADLGEEASE